MEKSSKGAFTVNTISANNSLSFRHEEISCSLLKLSCCQTAALDPSLKLHLGTLDHLNSCLYHLLNIESSCFHRPNRVRCDAPQCFG